MVLLSDLVKYSGKPKCFIRERNERAGIVIQMWIVIESIARY
jgi:hypothetical protein